MAMGALLRSMGEAASALVDDAAIRIHARRSARADTIVIVEEEAEFACFLRRGRAVELLCRGTPDAIAGAQCAPILRHYPVELRLDARHLIERRISIPPASLPYLRTVVRSQLQRILPWAPDKVAFDVELLHQGVPQDGQVEVRVVAIARSVLRSMVEIFADAGIHPQRVGLAADAPEAQSVMNLLADAEPAGLKRLRRSVAGLLILLAASGVGAWTASHLLLRHEQAASAELSDRLAAARAELAERVRGTRTHPNAAWAAKRQEGFVPAAILLNELSRVLPENTYLVALTFDDRRLTLSGLSVQASALIGVLENSGLLSSVSFAAPVSREQSNGLDRFEVQAEIGGDA